MPTNSPAHLTWEESMQACRSRVGSGQLIQVARRSLTLLTASLLSKEAPTFGGSLTFSKRSAISCSSPSLFQWEFIGISSASFQVVRPLGKGVHFVYFWSVNDFGSPFVESGIQYKYLSSLSQVQRAIGMPQFHSHIIPFLQAKSCRYGLFLTLSSFLA